MKKLIVIIAVLICGNVKSQLQMFMIQAQDSTPAYDTDAQAYFTAAGITDATQKSAVNTFVLAAKSNGYWTALTEIYPIVGGTSSTHAVNLKTPGTHNLTFSGGTHSSTGWNGNGSYEANTGIDYGSITNTSFTAVVYSRTNLEESSGSLFGAGSEMEFLANAGGSLYSDIPTYNNGNRLTIGSASSTAAMFTVTLGASYLHTVYRNATSIGSQTNNASTNSTNNIMIGSWGGGRYTARQIAFAAFSTTTGLSGAQVSNLYTDVQAMQTTLSRNN